MKFAALPSFAAVALVASVAAGQAITFITPLQPTAGTRAYGISSNGSVVAGHSSFGPAFRFSSSGGRQDLIEGGISFSRGYSISGDGSTVVGEGTGGAYVWRGPGNYQLIGHQAGYSDGAAEGVSGDGSVVVGRSYIPDNAEVSQAFRWTASTGLQGLGFTRPGHYHSEAFAISRDGSTIVGESRAGGGDAFIWRASTGMVALQAAPGTGAFTSSARGVNADGSIIVGYSGASALWAIWSGGSVTTIAGARGIARAVSDDGRVVVGEIQVPGAQVAAIWTPERGLQQLSTYLNEIGVTIPANVSLLDATAVSADGRTIAGYTGFPGTVAQGFVVTIPAPPAALALSILLTRRRRSRSL